MAEEMTGQGNPTAEGSTGTAGVAETGGTGTQGTTEPGSQSSESTEWLPEALRGNESLKGYKDPGELAQAHLELQAKYTVPEKPDEYTVALPEGAKPDTAFLSQAQQWAKEAGLTKDQFSKMGGKFVEMQAAQMKAVADADAKDLASLKSEWGDQYDGNMALAIAAAKKFGGDELAEKLKDQPFGLFAKTFLSVAKAIGDDNVMDTGGHPAPPRLTDASGLPRVRFPSMGE